MNVNKSAGRITGLDSNILASFRVSQQVIYCIGHAGLHVDRWQVNRPEHINSSMDEDGGICGLWAVDKATD